jgi:hypothetical protein
MIVFEKRPGLELEIITPHGYFFGVQISNFPDSVFFPGNYNQGGVLGYLCNINQGNTGNASFKGGGEKHGGEIGLTGTEQVCGHDIGASGNNRHVLTGFSVKTFFDRDVISSELGLGEPVQDKSGLVCLYILKSKQYIQGEKKEDGF